MAKAISFIDDTPSSSEYDFFKILTTRLGCSIENISLDIRDCIDSKYSTQILEKNQNKFSVEFINFLFQNVKILLVELDAFNPSGFNQKPNDIKYEYLLELAELYEEDDFQEEFKIMLKNLIMQFCKL